jgi:hypothetical protein
LASIRGANAARMFVAVEGYRVGFDVRAPECGLASISHHKLRMRGVRCY